MNEEDKVGTATISPVAPAAAEVTTVVASPLCCHQSSNTPPPRRCEIQNRRSRDYNDSWSLRSVPSMVLVVVLWTVATMMVLGRLESVVLLTNAFTVGALSKATFTTTTTSSTNLFVSNDFTRSTSSTSSRTTTSSSSPSSSSSSPSIMTQAGFRPKAERIGIRKRIRSVLENAKRRGGFSSSTSLSMSNNTTHNDASLIVAEAASIGGLYESVDFVLVNSNSNNGNNNGMNNRKNGTGTDSISCALKPVTTTNGVTTMTPSSSNGITALPEVKKNGLTLDNALQEKDRNGNTDTGVALQPKVNGVNGSAEKSATTSQNQVQVDAILNSGTVAPLPFRLPKLTREQKMKLVAGERIQEQSKMGRDGSGYVVLDVKAPDYVVWECLLDFEKYPEYIGTVRSMQMFTNTHLKQSYIAEKPVLPGTGRETRHYGTASITRASFVLSKFLLKIAAVHKYRPHPAGHYMEFTLDKACRNVVLKDAKGIWYTECNPDGRKGYTRIWLLCELSVSRVLPTFIVDYAAKRAMPRASNWIQPVVERVKKEFNIVD